MIVDDTEKRSLFTEIEKLRKADNLEYIDAIVAYCEQNDIDVELIGKIISNNPLMKSKVTIEAEEYNYIKKTSRLPL